MDLNQLYEPIVVAKPVRGRELRTKVIAKDGIGAAVQAIPEEGTTERVQDGNVEIYHEGYIDGKLYLVPDSNLQMMRDIVNFKMRRRLSSKIKTQSSIDEPNQYHEFNFKLDTLVDKIDKLVDESSAEESVEGSQLGSKERASIASDERTSKPRPSKQKKKKTLDKETVEDEIGLQTTDEQNRIIEEENEKTLESKTIPPILDDRIKYKPVKQQHRPRDNSFNGTYLSSDIVSGTKVSSPSIAPDLQYMKAKIPWHGMCSTEMSTEKFNLLISGHIKHGKKPIFIIQHSNASNILGIQKPDFKSHRKEGNIDIFLTGKFFTEDILEEDSSNTPSVININTERLLIDKKSKIHKDKFKDIFSIGPVDIALEGEFLKDEYTLKYAPLLTLEILRHSLENIQKQPPSTTVLFSREASKSPFQETGQRSSECDDVKQEKHVQYAVDSEEEDVVEIVNEEKESELERKSILQKMYTHIFKKKVAQPKRVTTVDNKFATSSSQIRQSARRNKRDKPILKGKAREKLDRRRNTLLTYDTGLPRVNSPERVCRRAEETKNINHELKSNTETKMGIKFKKKKKDKNQTIVENPILAQMQEFFIT